MSYLLGIDLGTSSVKALLCDENGDTVGGASSHLTVMQPRSGWSEQDPQDWWDAVVHAIRNVLAYARMQQRGIIAVGLTGQMHGSVFLSKSAVESEGADDAVAIRPALLWNDQRTASQCAGIERALGGRAEVVRQVGNAPLTGFTAPKILWLRENEPENFAQVAAVCLPKDYIGLRLTGVLATDVGDASGTLLFDVARRRWHDAVCAKLGIDPAILPPVHESAAVVGTVSEWAARISGLPRGIPVVAGSGDNMASAIGSGVCERGVVAGALGTSGVIIAHSTAPVVDAADTPATEPAGRTHTMCSAVGRDAWCVTGCMLSAGGSLKWVRDTLFAGVKYEELMFEASKVPPGSAGLVFLPYLTGERCPHPDPTARGGWIGLTARHGRAHLVRSVVEGVSFGMAEILDIVRGMDIEAPRVRLSGGGAKSPMWRQMLADVFGAPVALTNSEEGPSHGAALLAGVGIGRWSSVPDACRAAIRETHVTEPGDPEPYAASRRVYKELYADLKNRFKELGEIDRINSPA